MNSSVHIFSRNFQPFHCGQNSLLGDFKRTKARWRPVLCVRSCGRWLVSRGPAEEDEEEEAAAAHRLCSRLILIRWAGRTPAESAGWGWATAQRPRPLCFALLYQQAQMPFKKFTGSPDEHKAQEGRRVRGREEKERQREQERNIRGGRAVQSNEICYSGPFYTHLITRSNRFCETPSPFEDTPTTHVIWLVFYVRYQPGQLWELTTMFQSFDWGWMEGWRWQGDSLRWNHNLGQLKTDPPGSVAPIMHRGGKGEKKVAQLVPTQERFWFSLDFLLQKQKLL